MRKMESCIQGLRIPASAKQTAPNAEFTTRRSANANSENASIWGDRFLAYTPNSMEVDVATNQRREELKERVKKKLVGNFDKFSHQLDFIDGIQRLGVGYHFENEIDTILKKINDTIYHTDHIIDDLYTVSLSFRLLRQQGYPVSSDIFRKFKDRNGKFKESLTNDVRGLLSLYEAAYLRVRGENILDEALEFTTNQLNNALNNLKNPLKEEVTHALELPIRTSLTRLEARTYLTFYETNESHDKILSEFAKLDFNLLQNLHQKELSEVARWWKDLDFATKLPYARDRMVECYFWILGVYFEPDYSLGRRILSEVTTLISVIDDTYDVYGTLEELAIFTDAIERWDMNAMAQLPEYMQICYKALLDVYIMMEDEMAKLGKPYCVHYAKEAMKNLVRAYFQEAKWCKENYVPTFEEYMKVGLVSNGYTTLATTSLAGMGDIATEESFKWVSSDPLMLRASCAISRLQNDLVGHKENVVSAVECYMKQYGVSEKEAISEIQKQITNAWKDLNEECLRPTKVSMPLLTRVLNLARVINLVYNDGDGYTNSARLKGFVTSVLIDSMPI